MRDQAPKKRLEKAGTPLCPSCGREAVATATSQCIHCLRPLPGMSSRIEPGRIIQLADLERVKGRARGAGNRRQARVAGSLVAGVAVALAFLGLFGLCMRWLASFFARGVVSG
jgi:hypothetical protein